MQAASRHYFGVDAADLTAVQAARLARELGMSRILIPRTPGVLCALGLLMTDLRTDYSATQIMLLDDPTPDMLRGVFDGLRAQADIWFNAEAIAPEARNVAALSASYHQKSR